ncbi:prepilin-type N-terminal cleavage/methylation domain-containing protein [Alienimonas sp. DA493]|uniref:prepilin-type N-terminal cleavage/methylation domain-containing protein n=1 Tax=Alienimonas sp. DA493 TaxID=3373605 RepID=UPI003754CA77
MSRTYADPRPPRSGLTLVELTLALALAAMLAAATAGVTRGFVARRDALPPAGAGGPDRRLDALLRADLAAARRLHARPGRVTLLGYGGRDARTGRPNGRPAEVTLSVVGGGWLVRSVRPLDGADPRAGAGATLLRPGVAALRCERLDDGTDLTAAEGVTATAPVPDGLRLILLDAAGRPVREVVAGAGR